MHPQLVIVKLKIVESPQEPQYRQRLSRRTTKRPRKPMKDMNMRELCREWNTRAKVGLPSETAAGWLKKTERKRNAQGQLLRKAMPEARALKEICHYQMMSDFLNHGSSIPAAGEGSV